MFSKAKSLHFECYFKCVKIHLNLIQLKNTSKIQTKVTPQSNSNINDPKSLYDNDHFLASKPA